MQETFISVAKDFSTAPGGRLKSDGKFSGEEFRERFMEPHFIAKTDQYAITIDLDGTEGYATAFLKGCFGVLSEKFGSDLCLKRLKFISREDKLLIQEIQMLLEKKNGD